VKNIQKERLLSIMRDAVDLRRDHPEIAMQCRISTLAILAALLHGGALAATSGDFTVLSMNVAGLPAILQDNDVPGDKATNAGTIGSDFATYNYDIIHVQEVRVFLSWHPRVSYVFLGQCPSIPMHRLTTQKGLQLPRIHL
jgi:hypothetical protein